MLDSLANIKSRLGITTSDDDAFLTQQITMLSDVIEAYCRRKFNSSSWVQTWYCEDLRQWMRDTRELEMYHFPLISVQDISVDDTDLSGGDLAAAIRIHKPTGKIRRVDGKTLFGGIVVVSYTAGYASVPTPVLAVLDGLVSERYNKKKSGIDLNFGSDVQSISIPGAISIAYDFSLTNNDRTSAYGTIIGNYANVLDDWRSERAVVGNGKLEYVEAGS